MDLAGFSRIHFRDRLVKSADHLSDAADEFQRLAAVVGGIEDGAVVERAFIVDADSLADIFAVHDRFCVFPAAAATAATAAAATAAAALTAAATATTLAAAIFFLVVAVGCGIGQFPADISCHCVISAALSACKDGDPGIIERGLCAVAEPAADDQANAIIGEQVCQRFMADAAGADHFAWNNLSVVNGVIFEFLRASEMWIYVSAVIRDSDFHFFDSFP